MASPACHPCYPGSPICRFWQFSLGQMSQPSPYVHGVGNSIFLITRLHLGSLALQPAGLLDPPNGPLSRNLGFWVTPHTSFKLHGRTAEFPWSRFTGQVMRRTRHTDVVEFFHLFGLSGFFGFSGLFCLFSPSEIVSPFHSVHLGYWASGINFFGPGEITNPKASHRTSFFGPGEIGFAFHPVRFRYRTGGINFFGLLSLFLFSELACINPFFLENRPKILSQPLLTILIREPSITLFSPSLPP